jgi:hypothetical protein
MRKRVRKSMFVKCVDAINCTLTNGKIYFVCEESDNYVYVIDDVGEEGGFFRERFRVV